MTRGEKGVVIPLEASVVRACERLFHRTAGLWFIKTLGSAYARLGTPDFIVCYRGRFYGIEVKRPGMPHPLSAVQRRQLELIEASGGITAVVTSALEVAALLGIEGAA